jgi:hypothetical protein
VQHVNKAGEGVWVVLHLYKQGWDCLFHPLTWTQWYSVNFLIYQLSSCVTAKLHILTSC